MFPHSSPNLRGARHPSRALPSSDSRNRSLWLRPRPRDRRRCGLRGPAPSGCPARRTPRSRDSAGPAHLPPRDARPHSCRRSSPRGLSPSVRGAHACSACLSARTADLPAAPATASSRLRPRSARWHRGGPAPPARPMAGGGVTCAARGTPGGAGRARAPGGAGQSAHVLPAGGELGGWYRWGLGHAGAQGSCVKAVPLHVQGRRGSRWLLEINLVLNTPSLT